MNRLLLFSFLLICSISKAQIDKEFWFAIPKETSGHGSITAANNVSFKIAAMGLPANVVISMPANPAFVPRTLYVPANTSTIAVLATSFPEFATIYNNIASVGVEAQTGKTNRGILIQSDNDITAYYDYDNVYNRDLFSLKGKNALGTDFYCPFQQIWTNGTNYNPRPLSSIEIVATEDNTTVTIYPTIVFKGRSDKNPFTISLNRGEAFSLVSNIPLPSGKASGTRITSDKNIGVTINDDSEKGANYSCYDLIGDQLVPVNIIGSKYLVMSGSSSLTHPTVAITPHDISRGDQIIVTATQPNTVIDFRGLDGTVLYRTTLNAGQTDYFSVDITKANQTSVFVSSNDELKPLYVLHITGIGCELGGAILPSIASCTGSTEVTFYPSNISSQTEVTVNLMIPFNKNYAFNDSIQQPHYHFTLYNSKFPSGFQIPGSWFEKNDSAGWAVLSLNNRNWGQSGVVTGKDLVNWSANKIVNTQQLFHLGITNGRQGVTNKYGYFSSFNSAIADAKAYISGTESQTGTFCLGQTIKLEAKGGTEYTWHYNSPDGPMTYISDAKSASPEITGCPTGSHMFYVEIKSKCNTIVVRQINLNVIKPVAQINLDQSAFCSRAAISISNQSTEGVDYTWIRKVGNGDTMAFCYYNSNRSFQDSLSNNTSEPLEVQYRLVVTDSFGCKDTTSKKIMIYPAVKANFTSTDSAINGGLNVHFNNQSSENAKDFFWLFGDGHYSSDRAPVHEYSIPADLDTIFSVQLIATSNYFCTDTARGQIVIDHKVISQFTQDTAFGKTPLTIHFINQSKNAVSIIWNFGDSTSSTEPNPTHTFLNKSGQTAIDYKVSLTAIAKNGNIDSSFVIVTVLPNCTTIAKSMADKTEGSSPLSVNFYSLSRNASFYLWDFGDGSSSTDSLPTHIFVNNGTEDVKYTVKLNASDYYCGMDTTSLTIFVHPVVSSDSTGNLKVIASFTADTTLGTTPLTNHFTNKSINASRVVWNFGDSTTSSELNPTHVFYADSLMHKEYTVQLIAYGLDGSKDSISMRIYVLPACKSTAKIIADRTEGASPLAVQFSNGSNNATFCIWDFKDNSYSFELNPAHEFLNTSDSVIEYRVMLRSTDFNCDYDTTSIIIRVNPDTIESLKSTKNSVISSTMPKNSEIKFYPNPTKDIINLQYILDRSADIKIEVIESTGRLLHEFLEVNKPVGLNTTSIDLSPYNGTLFFVKILINEESKVVKVIKKK
jgi:PKD repeat protein